MVKLIRLASDNDCKFNADLDQGIKLKENSQIALQNITFDTDDFLILTVGRERDKVSFNLNATATGDVGALVEHHAFLKNESYNLSNINNFYKDLESKLNMCCKTDNTSNDNLYHSFMVVYDGKDGYEYASVNGVYMFMKLNPMSMMFNFNHDGKPRNDPADPDNTHSIMFESSADPLNANDLALTFNTTFNGSNGLDLGNIKNNGLVSTNLHEYFVYPVDDIRWSRGSGMYMARIHNLIDNSGSADTNGFAIGFSFTHLENATEGGQLPMTDAMRDFEIRVKRPTDDYEFVNPTIPNINQISTGNAPFKFNATTDPNQLTHDLILFEKNAQVITAKVINTSIAGGSATTIFSYTMTDAEHEKDLHPYIIVYAEDSDVEVGLPVISVDNLINPLNLEGRAINPSNNDDYEIVGQEQALQTLGDKNIYEVYKTNHGDGFVNGGDGFINDDAFNSNADPDILADYTPQLTIHSRLLQNMGFNIKGSSRFTFSLPTTELSNGVSPFGQFNLVPDGSIQITNSDNYIVVLDSIPLVSFDASEFDYGVNANSNLHNNRNKRGRQKSILATIPANNDNGIVEYQPNELVYIDLDNRFDLELKNIRLRVLNKQFGEIKTNGTSIMTLLIKD